jgi:hypothetical protein
MKIETAKAIVAAAEEIGLDSVRLYEDYSGRGMYGRTTTGVVADSWGDLIKCVALAAGHIAQDETDLDTPNEREDGLTLDDFVQDLDLSSDQMGRGLIVY